MRLLAVLLLAGVCGSGLAQSTNQFDPQYVPKDSGTYFDPGEKLDPKEGDLKLPPYPQPDALMEYEVLPSNGFRFFIDPGSVVAGSDAIVRYTLVVRSRSGTENVSFDGMRCKTNEHRVYATGRPADKAWMIVRDGQWKELKLGGLGRQHLVLMRDFFCPSGFAISSGDEGVDALRRGKHPLAAGNQRQFGPR